MNRKYDLVIFADVSSFVSANKELINIMISNKQEIYFPLLEKERLISLSTNEKLDKSIRTNYIKRIDYLEKLVKKKKMTIFGDTDNDVDLQAVQFLLKNTKSNVVVLINDKKRKDSYLILQGSFENEGHYIDVGKVNDMKIGLYQKKELVVDLVKEEIKAVIKENTKEENIEKPSDIVDEPKEEEDLFQDLFLAEPQEGEVLPESNDNPDYEKEYNDLEVAPETVSKIRNSDENKQGEEVDLGQVLTKENEANEVETKEENLQDEQVENIEAAEENEENKEEVIPEVVEENTANEEDNSLIQNNETEQNPTEEKIEEDPFNDFKDDTNEESPIDDQSVIENQEPIDDNKPIDESESNQEDTPVDEQEEAPKEDDKKEDDSSDDGEDTPDIFKF